MKKILLFLLIIIVLIVGGLAYLGFVPHLSPLMAKPKDLGVTADLAWANNFAAENEMSNELPNGVIPADREPVYTGSREIDEVFDSNQISSIIGYWVNQYGRSPIRDVQIRINDDGTGEASGILELSTAVLMAKQLGYNDQDIEKAKSYAKFVSGDLPFYIKGSGSVNNNDISFDASEVSIGRVTLPESIAQPVVKAAADAIERRMAQVSGATVEELSLQSEAVRFKGTVPATVE